MKNKVLAYGLLLLVAGGVSSVGWGMELTTVTGVNDLGKISPEVLGKCPSLGEALQDLFSTTIKVERKNVVKLLEDVTDLEKEKIELKNLCNILYKNINKILGKIDGGRDYSEQQIEDARASAAAGRKIRMAYSGSNIAAGFEVVSDMSPQKMQRKFPSLVAKYEKEKKSGHSGESVVGVGLGDANSCESCNKISGMIFYDQDGSSVQLKNGCDIARMLDAQASFIQTTLKKKKELEEEIEGYKTTITTFENMMRQVCGVEEKGSISDSVRREAARNRHAGNQLFWAINRQRCGNFFIKFFNGELSDDEVAKLFFEFIPSLVEAGKQQELNRQKIQQRKEEGLLIFGSKMLWEKHERKFTYGTILALILCFIYQNYAHDINDILSGMSSSPVA